MSPESWISPVLVSVPAFIALFTLEWILVARSKARGRYTTKDSITSLSMGIGNVIFAALFAFILTGGLILAWDVRFFTIETTWLTFAICFLLDDMVYYWKHRLSHRIRWFWADHVIHHSSTHYNLTTALRQPWFTVLSGAYFLAIPLVLIGFDPYLIIFCRSANLVYQFWIHTEAVDKMPRWFEAVFNTPSHHRVHHGRNAKYLDANYAGVLIIWDKLFGSFVPEDESEPVDYGLVTNLDTHNPLRVATHEYVAIGRDVVQRGIPIWQRLAYIFAPPGWCHDGSRQTSTQIKQEAGVLPVREHTEITQG